ncbi:MAG: branched-chain amino acid ABC transporter permease, partial [Desulfobacca sp.]|nr:branched-chain amino acid ABC transporter permease [Desulfobacca sp.]
MDMKRDYYEDIQLFESGVVVFWTAVLFLFLFTLPIYTPPYYIFLMNLVLVHVILAVGLNILVGSTGQISLGHAGFFAIGAYGTALLMTKLHLPFLLALPLAGFIAAFFGFILGLPALRLEGPYLAIASLGFGLTIMHIIGRWDIFGGRMGIQTPPLDLGIPQLGLSWIVTSDKGKYFLILL